jgi:integrase
MRLGEIVSLQWQEAAGMTVYGTKVIWTKNKRDRRIPISSRLRKILEMRRFDPARHPMALDAYVFGNAIGQQVDSVKRAWSRAVLRSHGHQPAYTTTGQLDEASRLTLDTIDLH